MSQKHFPEVRCHSHCIDERLYVMCRASLYAYSKLFRNHRDDNLHSPCHPPRSICTHVQLPFENCATESSYAAYCYYLWSLLCSLCNRGVFYLFANNGNKCKCLRAVLLKMVTIECLLQSHHTTRDKKHERHKTWPPSSKNILTPQLPYVMYSDLQIGIRSRYSSMPLCYLIRFKISTWNSNGC